MASSGVFSFRNFESGFQSAVLTCVWNVKYCEIVILCACFLGKSGIALQLDAVHL